MNLMDTMLQHHIALFLNAREAVVLAMTTRWWRDVVLGPQHTFVRWNIRNTVFTQIWFEACRYCDRLHHAPMFREIHDSGRIEVTCLVCRKKNK
jgi:hypothetical protein